MIRVSIAALLAGLVFISSPAEAAKARHGAARHTMSFVPGERSRLVRSHGAHRSAAHPTRHSRSRPVRGRERDDEESGAAATASPGAGFKMVDGVLTYPAPARFQPKVLKRR